MRDYGNAIRELATVNVFPGDMLFRNFGLTRFGRVVFYDYDEIEASPTASSGRSAAAGSRGRARGRAWFGVGALDVFPEESAPFLLGDPVVRDAFLAEHADLLGPAFWQDAKRRVGEGEIVDFFPYPEAVRFCRRTHVARRIRCTRRNGGSVRHEPIVQKYGGTSVGDPERIRASRERIVATRGRRATRSASSSRRWATRPTSCSTLAGAGLARARTRASATCC